MDEKPLICQICSSAYLLEEDFKLHMAVHLHEKGGFFCNMCQEDFPDEKHLTQHFISKHNAREISVLGDQDQFFCSTCKLNLNTEAELAEHKLTHQQELNNSRPNTCSKCNEIFSTTEEFCAHKSSPGPCFEDSLPVQSPSRPTEPQNPNGQPLLPAGKVEAKKEKFKFLHRCTICGMIFDKHNALRTHIAIYHTDNGDKTYPCPICGKLYTNSKSMQSHRSYSHKRKTRECEICQQTCATKRIYQRHLLVHTGEKPFLCDVCGKAFRVDNQLKRHLRTHSGEKKFICSVCSKPFTQKHHLNRHVRGVHNKEQA